MPLSGDETSEGCWPDLKLWLAKDLREVVCMVMCVCTWVCVYMRAFVRVCECLWMCMC